MSTSTLEERVARLETLVENLLRDKNRYPSPGKDWRSTIGMFDGDPLFKEMLEEATRRREEERREAREHEGRESS
jgi:hypothetical protein